MANVFENRSLGQTGISVTPIGLGMMEFAGGADGMIGGAFPSIEQQEKNAAVLAGLKGGINWFDTAELYGHGLSERSLSTALKAAGKTDADVVVATKWWPLFRTAGNIPQTIHDRLRFLDGFSISNYMVHQPYGLSSVEAQMDAMAELVKQGLIRSVGVSNFDAQKMTRAAKRLEKHGLPLAVNQMKYSPMDRTIERNGVLETARKLGVTIIAYSPLESGLLTGKYHRDPSLLQGKHFFYRSRLKSGIEKSRALVAELEQLAQKYAVTPAQVALNWLICSAGDTVVTIPGITKTRQAEESAGALTFRLSDEDRERITRIKA